MSTVQTQIEIDAPVKSVWDTVMDPQRLGEWVTIHKSLKQAPQGQLDQGDEMEQVFSMRGVSFTVHWKLSEVQEPKVAVWEGKGPARSKARIRYELSGDGEGPTKFEYTNEFTPPGGKLGNLAGRVVVGAASEREANNSLKRLKELVEKG